MPLWLTYGCSNATGWAGSIYYTVSKLNLDIPGQCDTCVANHVTLDGNNVNMLLITPGAYTGSPARNWPDTNPITGYFEDSANSNNNNDIYITPTARTFNADRIYKLP